MQSGDMARANRLATLPGLLNDSPRAQQLGHQLKDLGRGGEGLASAVAHPTHGAVARKIYDPAAGVYSPQVVRRKEQLGPVANMAQYLGKSETQHGTPIHFSEYVPGQQVDDAMMAHGPFAKKFRKAKAEAEASGRAQGRELRDLRPGNAQRTPEGDVKFVDTMPFNRNEVLHPDIEAHDRAAGRLDPGELPVAGQGYGLFPNLNDPRKQTSNDQFKQYMLGGKTTGGTRSSNYAALNSTVPPQSAIPTPLATQAPHPVYGRPAPLDSSSDSVRFRPAGSSTAPTQAPLARAPTAVSPPPTPAQPNTVVSRKRNVL